MNNYTPGPGEHIEPACRRLVELAKSTHESVMMEFNGTTIVATQESDPAVLSAGYLRELDLRHEDWIKTPKGQRANESGGVLNPALLSIALPPTPNPD